MISYELAKKLKDAGFPQRFEYGCEYYSGNTPFKFNFQDIEKVSQEKQCQDLATYIPPLSELIEYCMDANGIFDLYNGNKRWEASMIYDEGTGKTRHLHGSTPEEAVASLWLELNKK